MNTSSRNTLLLSLFLGINLFGAKGGEKAAFCLPDLIELSKPVIRAMHAQFTPYTVKGLSDLIRQPSVSTNPEAISETANQVAKLMKEIAPAISRVKILRVNGPKGMSAPYVFGHWIQNQTLPTVFVYAHGDVQPATAANWRTPPFEPTLRGGRLYGRGATDNKSGILIFLSALRALAATGGLPVNVKFLVEAEEEVGSPNFATFCEQHPEKIKADAVLIADSGSRFHGVPAMTVSARGGVMLSLKLEALRNGVHSGVYGGAAPNAMWGMIQLLTSMTNARQELIIPGLKDMQIPITAADRRAMAELGIPHSAVAENAGLLPGVSLAGNPAVHPLFAIGRGASIHAVEIVPSEAGPSTLPASASANLVIRLAPGMDPRVTFQAVEKYLQANRPLGMKLTVESKYEFQPWANSIDSEGFRTAASILQHVYNGRPVQLYNEGGGLPLLNLLTAINDDRTPVIFYGADEPGNNIHGNNESVSLKVLKQNIKATIYFLTAFGGPIPTRPTRR